MSRKKIKGNEIVKSIEETLEASSIHAIPNIIRAKNLPLRIIWLFFLLLSASACCWDMINNISTFLELKVVTNIQVNNAFQLPFPIVSICDQGKLMDTLTGIESSRAFQFEDFNLAKFLNTDIPKNDFESYNDSWYGDCIRFNSGKSNNGSSNPFKHINERGWDYSLALFINSKIKPVLWFSNETTDSSEDEGKSFSPGFDYMVNIKKLTINKQAHPYSKCVNDLTKESSYKSEVYRNYFRLKNSSNYRYTKCINLCRQKYYGETCGMQAEWLGIFFFPEMKSKQWEEMNGTEKNCWRRNKYPSIDYLLKCDCPIECITNQYSIDYSFTRNDKNQTRLSIFYNEMTETVISEEPKMDLSGLISAIGGTLGVFTGASFLSFIEIVELITKIANILLQRRKNRPVTF